MTNKDLAKQMIRAYFGSLTNITSDAVRELLLISQNDMALLEHIKAWINILTRAKEEIENEQKN